LTTLKDQLGYAARDFFYYKKRAGRDVATLQPLDFVRHAELMLQDNESEKEIRLVLTKEQVTAQQVSITPLKRPRQQLEKDDHPFMDDPFDAYKEWLEKLPPEQSEGISFTILHMFLYCPESWQIYINYTLSNMFLFTNRFEG